jgi:L-methionine (R)-S-oxide reductase
MSKLDADHTARDQKPSARKTPLQTLESALAEAKRTSVPATPKSLHALYQYQVPKLSADGTCSIFDSLDETPYDLARALGGVGPTTTLSLLMLRELVECVQREMAVDWIGVYQARRVNGEATLVKLSYRGAPSRAEFPLNQAFAAKSNNVAVALSGEARIINDVHAHIAAGGAYYECDPKVRSEACVPFSNARGVCGIIDAEHAVSGWFSEDRMQWLHALCEVLPGVLPEGGL